MNASASSDIQPGAYVQVNDLHMVYETQGAGIPIILLHGGLETCQMWAPVIPAFSSQYQVLTPDSRGHGRTDNPSGKFSYPLMAEDIAQLIHILGLKKPFVVGYSDGGQTALEMAMTYPGLARGYLLGGIFNSMTDEWRAFTQNFLGFDSPGIVDFERVVQTNPEFVQSLQDKHDTFHMPGYWKTLLSQISACWMRSPAYTKADLAKISDATLFWCGDRDVFCPPEQNLEMYRMVNKAELAVIPNADHFTMMQQADIAMQILLDFMERVIQSE